MKTPRHVVASALTDRINHGAAATPQARRKLADEIAAYLLDNKRSGDLDSLLRDIMQQRADGGIVELTAVSAFPLADEVRTDIEQQVRSLYPKVKQIIISERLDTSVVAGVKLEFANQQLDLTVRNKLNRLKTLTARM